MFFKINLKYYFVLVWVHVSYHAREVKGQLGGGF